VHLSPRGLLEGGGPPGLCCDGATIMQQIPTAVHYQQHERGPLTKSWRARQHRSRCRGGGQQRRTALICLGILTLPMPVCTAFVDRCLMSPAGASTAVWWPPPAARVLPDGPTSRRGRDTDAAVANGSRLRRDPLLQRPRGACRCRRIVVVRSWKSVKLMPQPATDCHPPPHTQLSPRPCSPLLPPPPSYSSLQLYLYIITQAATVQL